jgi:surface polysaccharide O-acyltransferase-like enzyme
MKYSTLKSEHTPAHDSRQDTLDLIKVIAIYFVMIIHVSAASLYSFSKDWIATITVDSVARPAVPLFLMVTGALLLPRQHSVTSIIQRVQRIIVPLIVWSFVYLIYLNGLGQASGEWLMKIIGGPTMYHLWYLYSLIGLYIFMPVFSGFYQTASSRVVGFCLIVWLLAYTLLPVVREVTGFNIGVDWGFHLFGGYLVLGAFANDSRRNALLNSRFAVPVLLAVWFASIALTAYFTYAWSTKTGGVKETFFFPTSPPVAIGSFVIFLLAGKLEGRLERMSERSREVLQYFSATSFGVYLLHVLILQFIQKKGFNSTTGTPWLAIPLISLFLLIVCSILVKFMQGIPYVRRLVS